MADDQALTAAELHTLEGLLAKLSGRSDLPWQLFRFVTEVAATPNVDLLVQDDRGRVLLAWRDDPFGTGWHVPGSIIRHREEIGHRIALTAQEEFGCMLAVGSRPVAMIQIFDDRGHSVSLCYTARLLGTPERLVSADAPPRAGDLRWFDGAPDQWYPSHLVYAQILEALAQGLLGAGAAVFTQHVGRRDAAQTQAGGVISADARLD